MWRVLNIYIVICIVYWNYRTNAVDTCITTHLHNAFTLYVFLCDFVRLILISKIAEMYLPPKLVECDCFVLIYSKILGGLFANTMWVLQTYPCPCSICVVGLHDHEERNCVYNRSIYEQDQSQKLF